MVYVIHLRLKRMLKTSTKRKTNVASPVIFETLSCTPSNVVLYTYAGPQGWRGLGRRCTKSMDDKYITELYRKYRQKEATNQKPVVVLLKLASLFAWYNRNIADYIDIAIQINNIQISTNRINLVSVKIQSR